MTNGFLALYFTGAAAFGEVALCRIGSGLLAIGFAFALYRLLSTRPSSPPGADAAALDCAAYYRDQLQRRLDMLKTYWTWGIAPTLPGALLATLGWILAEPANWYLPTGVFAFFLACQYVTLQWSRRTGARVQKELDRL